MANKTHKVLDKFIKLRLLKDIDGFLGKLDGWIDKSKLKITKKDAQQSDYRTFTSRAVSDQQKADILHNMPIYDYIGLDSEGKDNVFALKESWKYWWKVDETDKKIYEVVSDASDFGSGILYQGWKIEDRWIEEMDDVDGKLTFNKKKINQYSGVYSEFISIENFFIDGTTIDNSNEAIWVVHWDKAEYIKAHELNINYKGLKSIPAYSAYLETKPNLPKIKSSILDNELVQELRYYNKAEDKLIILANGKEVYNTPIPHLHKELPFVKFDNHIIRDRFIQMGNYELLDEHEKYIDAIRSQSVDVTKANIGFNVVNKDSDFNPEITKIGVHNFIELEDINGIKHVGNNIQPSQLGDLETRASNDVITITGVDYKQQLLGASSETAKKVSSRNEAQAKRTNLILKKNSFNFYNRLAKLRLADMQWINKIMDVKMPLKGNDQTDTGFSKVQDGYGLFTVKKNMLKGKFNIILQTESLLGNSSEKEKENYLSYFQIFGNLQDDNGKNILSKRKQVEVAGKKLGIDVDLLTESDNINKSGKQIIEEMDALSKGQDLNSASTDNPNFIPGANRANVSGGVNVIGGGNTNQ